MSDSMSFLNKLRQTITGGKIDISLDDTLPDLETVDDELGNNLSTDTDPGALDVVIKQESMFSKLEENDDITANRYETIEQLPSNNADEIVISLQDNNLNRAVEARVLAEQAAENSEDVGELIHEALILSLLDHPGIPPIYDLDLSMNHQIYCVMKKINGFPLSDLTQDLNEKSEELSAIHKFDTVNGIVEFFLKIADIIAYAHSRQIIHRNLKPENFLVGEFGEVYVIGWNAARDLENDEADDNILRGTPLYMSPEQAACVHVDKRSDIYSFGASLYHVLMKRPHMMRDSFDVFWNAKKEGLVDEAHDLQEKHVPAVLMAICHRCLKADPEQRYQSFDELIADLKYYQSDRMVDIQSYSLFKFTKVWLKRNAGILKLAVIVLVIAGIVGGVYYQRYLERLASWGDPIYQEAFDKGDAWRESWVTREASKFEVIDGRLQAVEGQEFVTYYKKRIHGGVAIEFEGEMLGGSIPGDLSVIYSPNIEGMANNKLGERILTLQHGAVGNACSMIEGPQGRLDYVTKSLENGVKYKVRAEIDGKKLRLYLDDALVCTYDLLFPVESGYIGIYAFHKDKAFDNVKIYNRVLPRVTDIIKTGDLLFENALYEVAAERYRKIGTLHPGTDLEIESKYKLGLCKYNLEDVEGAFEIWDTLLKSDFEPQIRFYRWKELAKAFEYNELLRQMYAMYRIPMPRLKTQIREQWGIFLKEVRAEGNQDLTQEFLRFREVNFPDDQVFALETYNALKLIGETEKTLTYFPNQNHVVLRALRDMGEYQKIIDEYSHVHGVVAASLRSMGQQQKVIDEHRDITRIVFDCLLDLGRFAEAEQLMPKQRLKVLLMQEKFEQVLSEFGDDKELRKQVLYMQGKAQEFMDLQEDPERMVRGSHGFDARTALVFERYIKGDKKAITQIYDYVERVPGWLTNNTDLVFQVELLPDILLHLEGNPEALKRTADRIWSEKRRVLGMRHWYNVALMSGKIDKDEYAQQPNKRGLQADYYIYKGLFHDLYGDKKNALILYQAYKQLPLHQLGDRRTITDEKFIDYRIDSLK